MELTDLILDWVFPRHCPVCDKIVKPLGEKICQECRGKLLYVFEPKCKKCGKKLQDVEKEYCFDCATKRHFYDQGAALYEYTSVKSAIYRLKYQKRCENAIFFGEEAAMFLGPQIREWKAEVIIPVPLHRTKKNVRGYNQAELLAKSLGSRLGIPVDTTLMERCKKTVPQKELDERARQNNLKKAFKICRNDVKLNSIILLDDIYTTGSTIDAMALEFKKNGVGKVYFIALAIGEGF